MVSLNILCPKCKILMILGMSGDIICRSCNFKLKKKENISFERWKNFIDQINKLKIPYLLPGYRKKKKDLIFGQK